MDPTDAAHVLQTPDEYADFLGGLSFDKRIEMINSFRCAELQGAEELRILSETVDDPDLAKKFARHASDEEKHGAYFGEIMQRLGVEPFDPPDEPDHITIGGRLIVDTLNDIEEILPARRDRRAGPGDPDPHPLPGGREPRPGLVRGPPTRLRGGRPGDRRADRRDHRRREPPRPLRARAAGPVGRGGLGGRRRDAQEATDAREERAREWAAERLEAERLREEGKLSPT